MASRERPIIFSAESVRALLNGSKTQTRRLVKPPPSERRVLRIVPSDGAVGLWDAAGDDGRGLVWHSIACPFGVPGNRLWVRETWAHDGPDLATVRSRCEDALPGGESYGPYYLATETAPDTLHWRSPIHMPRWASRLTLEIVDVRVQRLQEISEEDAESEGMGEGIVSHGWQKNAVVLSSAVGRFRMQWDEINGKRAIWSSNPFVWSLSFRVIR